MKPLYIKNNHFIIAIIFNLILANVNVQALDIGEQHPSFWSQSWGKKLRTVVLGGLLLLSRTTPVFTESVPSVSSLIDPNVNLQHALSLRLGLSVTATGENFVFSGSSAYLEAAYGYFEDFDSIAEDFVPLSTSSTIVRARKAPCQTVLDFFEALGLDPSTFRSMNMGDITKGDLKARLPFASSFDKKAVSMFEDHLQTESPFVKWLILNQPGFKQADRGYVTYDFGMVKDYLCGLSSSLKPIERDFTSGSLTLPIRWVMGHLIAAASGDVTLQEASGGKFKVRTLQQGKEISTTNSYVLDLVTYVDTSGSMGGDPIASVNALLPELFKFIQKSLKEGMVVQVKTCGFSDQLTCAAEFPLSISLNPPDNFKSFSASGSTDLRFIGDGLARNEVDNPKVVVAFTDGMHSDESNLPKHYDQLLKLQKTGRFGYPITSFVGSEQSPEYLQELAKIFGGKTFLSSDTQNFFNAIGQSIDDLLDPRSSIVFSLNGVTYPSWIKTAEAGMVTLDHEVSNGETVTYNGITYTVDRSGTASDESKVKTEL